MSKYTTELRFICEQLSGLEESQDGTHVTEIINIARPKIFDFDYPIFDEEYKEVLETKILKHYYTQEIGFETYGLWKLKLETRLNEIMPYYNQLYESELLLKDVNPLYNVDYNTDYQGNDNGTSNTTRTYNENKTQEDSGISRDAYSDTPQGGLTDVDNLNYLTNYDKKWGESTSTGETESSSADANTSATTSKYLRKVLGKNGGRSYGEELKHYRSTFINTDYEIIKDLKNLFMLVW